MVSLAVLGVGDVVELRGGGASVVLRVRWVVSADGGGGREANVEARQRKHSPLPKYEGAG